MFVAEKKLYQHAFKQKQFEIFQKALNLTGDKILHKIILLE